MPHHHAHGLIFSDIDGTFLDESYRHPFSAEFLRDVFSRYHVVFVSSRTIEEMLVFQQRIGYAAPFIAENGAVVVFPEKPGGSVLARAYRALDETVMVAPLGFRAHDLAPLVKLAASRAGVAVRASHEMTLEEIAGIGAYSREDASHAQTRTHSVAVTTQGMTQNDIVRFTAMLKEVQCESSIGGKWIIITRETDKGRAVLWYRAYLHRCNEEHNTVAAIGNEENDAPMLRAVNIPFAVNNPGSEHAPSLSCIPHVYLLRAEGVEGWREMIQTLDAMLVS